MKTERTKELFLEAFERCGGNVSRAVKVLKSKKIKIARRTYYNWCADDPEFKKEIDRIERSIDLSDIQEVEWSMRTLAKGVAKYNTNGEFKEWEIEPCMKAAKLYMEAKARRKGYGNSEQTVTVKHDTRTAEEIQNEINKAQQQAEQQHYDIESDLD